MSQPITALQWPARPIQVDPASISRPRLAYLSIVILFLLAVLLTAWQAPGILRDLQLKSSGTVTNEFHITKGECTTRNLVFTDCDTKFQFITASSDRVYSGEASFMFLDWSTGDYAVDVIYDADDPSRATLSLGTDKILNRSLTWGAFAILLYGGSFFMLAATVRSHGDKKKLATASPLSTVAVELKNFTKRRKSSLVTYSLKTERKWFKHNIFTKFPAGQEPLLLHAPGGKPFGVAVIHQATSSPILLDRGLTRLNLTDDERKEIWRQLASMQ